MITYIDPWLCEPPHRVTHANKLQYLLRCFSKSGWDNQKPALIGYWDDESVQLLSGSHRLVAARMAGILVPVVVWDREAVEDAFGNLDRWQAIMASGAFTMPVQALSPASNIQLST